MEKVSEGVVNITTRLTVGGDQRPILLDRCRIRVGGLGAVTVMGFPFPIADSRLLGA